MGPNGGGVPFAIAGGRGRQSVGKRGAAVPARLKPECQVESDEFGRDLGPVWLQGDHHPLAARGQALPFPRHLRFPGPDLPGPTAQRRIALLERPLIPRPGPGEGMFHVEHRPVEPATTTGRALFDQFVGVRVQGLHWKRQGQFGHGSGGGAIQARDRTAALAPFAADLETQGMDRAG